MKLEELGARICILGPSNSGKSTLAHAIGQARALAPVHLDQLHHLPGSAWVPRPAQEFVRLHDAAIAGERWVMEGNYSQCLPRRLERATGVILLDVSTTTSLVRYLRRTWFEEQRHGGLDGASERVRWNMLRYIAFATHRKRRSAGVLFDRIALPKVALRSVRAIARFYRAEGLER